MSSSPTATSLTAPRTNHQWSFIRVGLWASLAVLVMLVLVGLWSYRQTNLMLLDAQEKTGRAIATALGSAVEENLITRDYAQVEVELQQAMSNTQVRSVLIADINGKILSEVRRDPLTGQVSVMFDQSDMIHPERQPIIFRNNDMLDILLPVGRPVTIGWVKLRLTMMPDDALLGGIHQQLWLILGLGALTMFLVVGFSLRATYSRVQTTQTQMEEMNDSLHSVAFYDALTQLPNRQLLADRLKQALAVAGRTRSLLAVCYLDLDGFKPVNDQYGHDAGDALLVEISGRLVQSLREHDTVARVGGDEFVLLINVQSVEMCAQIIQRLLEEIAKPIIIQGYEVSVAASIGVALCPLHGYDPETLVMLADRAMYIAKANGKNCYSIFGS